MNHCVVAFPENEDFACGVSSHKAIVPCHDGVKRVRMVEDSFAVFRSIAPKGHHAIPSSGAPRDSGRPPRQVVDGARVAPTNGRSSGGKHAAKIGRASDANSSYVSVMQVIWILTAVLIVTLFIQYRRRLKR